MEGFVTLAPSLAAGFVIVSMLKLAAMLAGLFSLRVGTAFRLGAAIKDVLGYDAGLDYVTVLGPSRAGWSRIKDVTPMMKPWS